MSPRELRDRWKAKVAADVDALTDEMVLALHGDQYEIETYWHGPYVYANTSCALHNIDPRLSREYGKR